MRPRIQQPNTKRLPDDAVELAAAALDALADPTRIRIIERLAEGDASGEELEVSIGLDPESVESQVEILSAAGVVISREEDDCRRLRLADSASWWVIEQITEAIVPTPDAEHLTSRVDPALGPQDQETTDSTVSRPGDGRSVDDRCGGI